MEYVEGVERIETLVIQEYWGRFNLLTPDDTNQQVRFVFNPAASGPNVSTVFVLDEDHAVSIGTFDTPLEVMDAIIEELDRYVYHGGLKDAVALRDWMAANEAEVMAAWARWLVVRAEAKEQEAARLHRAAAPHLGEEE